MNEDVFVYRVDAEDRLASVSENWVTFAQDNAWAGRCSPDKVLGQVLWTFIQDRETRHLYTEIFKRVRMGKGAGPIPFRCDSPQERRFLQLVILPLEQGHIEITSRIVRREPRERVDLLDTALPRSGKLIRICSMCKKIAVNPDEWVDMEDALARMRLFEADSFPGLTHGLCPVCYRIAMSDLE